MSDALGIALSGLRVAQRGIDVVSSNITNASTTGYTRKILPTETQLADGQGIGVRYGEIQRYVDQSILRDYRVQLSSQNYYKAKEGFLARALDLHGATHLETNIGAQIGRLTNSFVELSLNPDSRTLQTDVLNNAQRLATNFNTIASELLAIRNEAQATITNEVGNLNAILRDLASFNRKISTMTAAERSTATLEDQRDMLVKKLSELIDVTYYSDGSNVLTVQTKQGHVLVDTEPREVRFDNQNLTYQTYYPQSLGGLEILDSGGNAVDLIANGNNPGGKIGGLLSLRDRELPQYLVQIDELAHKMMMRLEAQGLTLFTDATGTVPANDPSVYAGIAATIRVNPLVTGDPSLIQRGTAAGTVPAGSNQVIRNVLDYAFGKFADALGTPNVPFNTQDVGYNGDIDFFILSSSNMTLEEFARAMLDHQAQDYSITKATLETETQYLHEVEKRFLDTVGVNVDEEMIKMIELQKTYTASAKMISTLDELFSELLRTF